MQKLEEKIQHFLDTNKDKSELELPNTLTIHKSFIVMISIYKIRAI